MPPNKDDLGSPRTASPSPHCDPAESMEIVWVHVDPLQERQGIAKNLTAAMPSSSSMAHRAMAGDEYSPFYRPPLDVTTYTMDPIPESDTGTSSGPPSPATSAAQTETSGRPSISSPGRSRLALNTHHELPYHENGTTHHRHQQQQQQPTWEWKTLLVDDKNSTLPLGLFNCAAITIREEDILSNSALKARVLATLQSLARRVDVPDHVLDWLHSEPDVEVCLTWHLNDALPREESYYSSNVVDKTDGNLAHETPLCLADHDGLLPTEEEEASWLRENLELAASGCGNALLVVRAVPRDVTDEGEEDEEIEEDEEY